MRKKLLFLSLFCFITLAKCFSQQAVFTKEKLKGEWVSKQGEIFIIQDNSCLYSDSYSRFFKYKLYKDQLSIFSTYDTLNIKVELLNDSLITSHNEHLLDLSSLNRLFYDTVIIHTFYRLENLAQNKFHFKFVSCAPFPDFELDSSGNFYRGYSTTTLLGLPTMNVKKHDIKKGILPGKYMAWLEYFFSLCKWDTLKNYYEPKEKITDQHTETFYLRLISNKTYCVAVYGYSGPSVLRSALDFLNALSTLIGTGYIKSSPIEGNHFFHAALAGIGRKEDTIKYMQDFDSLNYYEPVYPGGLNKIMDVFKMYAKQGLTRIFLDCTVNHDGLLSSNNDTYSLYGNKEVTLDDNIELAISKLALFKPAIFKGLLVPFRLEIEMDFVNNTISTR
jgi:hypothetical protein